MCLVLLTCAIIIAIVTLTRAKIDIKIKQKKILSELSEQQKLEHSLTKRLNTVIGTHPLLPLNQATTGSTFRRHI